MNSRLPWAPMLAVLLLNAATVAAHTLAGTIVSVVLNRPGIVTVTIAAEADPLIAKLEALGDVMSETPTNKVERRARLESLLPLLLANIDGRLGGKRLDFTLRDVAVDDTAQVEVHLSASVPPHSTPLRAGGPQTFTWRSTFIFGAYQVAISTGDAGEAIQWLQGPQTSTPIAVEPSGANAWASLGGQTGIRIGYSLAMGALVLYVISRRRTAHRLAGG